MFWQIDKDDDAEKELGEASARARKFIIPFVIILFAIIFSAMRFACQRSYKRFVSRTLQTIVNRKYKDERNHNAPTIRLRFLNEELYFSHSRYYYDSLQVGDSLYKPAGSEYFFLVEHRNGVRTLRKLRNDKH